MVIMLQLLDSNELKFQFSFKIKIVENVFGNNGDIWVGYIQSLCWQVYNVENLCFFCEINYELEVMMMFCNGYLIGGWCGCMSGISFNYMFNGCFDLFLCSWNWVIVIIGLDCENWVLVLCLWYCILEDCKDDNNLDIEDYMGCGDVILIWNCNGYEVLLMVCYLLCGGDCLYGVVQFDYGFLISNLLCGYVQVFDGYGESMIDYNYKVIYVGVGVLLLEWY